MLDESESKALLAAYGIAGPKEIIARSNEDAVTAAEKIGYPVVIKALSQALLHKSDAGGVILDIANADGVRAACEEIAETVERRTQIRIESFLVCEQVKGGVELALGLHRDPEMGVLMMVGSGGLLLELIADTAFAAPPVSLEDARVLIDRLKIAKVLHGYRGAPAHDIDKIAQAVAALGRLATDLADVIVSLDVNPLVSRPNAAPLVLDAAVILEASGKIRGDAGR
jgi:succinyl-CoA synthetase beta subunit